MTESGHFLLSIVMKLLLNHFTKRTKPFFLISFIVFTMIYSTEVNAAEYDYLPTGEEMPFSINVDQSWSRTVKGIPGEGIVDFYGDGIKVTVRSISRTFPVTLESYASLVAATYAAKSSSMIKLKEEMLQYAPYPYYLEFLIRHQGLEMNAYEAEEYNAKEAVISMFGGKKIVHISCVTRRDMTSAYETDCMNVILSLKTCGNNGFSLNNMLTVNSIHPACKASLYSVLPAAQNNYKELFLPLGVHQNNESFFLVFLATADYKTLPYDSIADSISIKLNDKELAVTSHTTLDKASGIPFHVSFLIDYSGSMEDNDITAVSQMMLETVKTFGSRLNADVFYFSGNVAHVLDNSAEFDALSEKLKLDTGFSRGSTALYDGIASAIDVLAERRGIRFVLAATDGGENSSTTYDMAGILDKIGHSKIPVILTGILFSDLDFYKQATAESRGFFVYEPVSTNLNKTSAELNKLLKSAIVLSFARSNLQSKNQPSTVTVNYKNQSFGFTLPATEVTDVSEPDSDSNK